MGQLIDLIDNRQVLVTAVEFGKNEMIISFQEKRHVGKSALKSQSILIAIDSQQKEEEYMELQDDLVTLIDRAEQDILENPAE